MDKRTEPSNASETDEESAAEHQRLGLAELAEMAGVSLRTVRYYISEGLLPPPEGAGPRSSYSSGHLDRLRLIGRLKDAFLPLREIRRRLDGLDDNAVRGLIARLEPTPTTIVPPQPPDSAADYLNRVMRQGQPPAPPAPPRGIRLRDRQPPGRPLVAEVSASPTTPRMEKTGGPIVAAAHGHPLPDWPATGDPDTPPFDLDPALTLVPPAEESEPPAESAPWRRIRLGPDAELLVREATYHRRRDRIDWLIRWARKVFA